MPSMARNCLVINLDRCIGCYACEVACKMENDIALGERWNKVVQVEPFGEFPHVSTYWLPVMCQQCEESPCTHVCPPARRIATRPPAWCWWTRRSASAASTA